eukprot:IDg20551t1
MPEEEFEDIALDSDASKPSGGLPACLQYCEQTSTVQSLSPSLASFFETESRNVPSLGLARLRLSLQHHGFLEFEIDIIDEEFPLLFGHDHHLIHR